MTPADLALLRKRGTPLGCACPERNLDPILDALDAAEAEHAAFLADLRWLVGRFTRTNSAIQGLSGRRAAAPE